MKKIKLTENSVYRFVTFLALSFLCIFFMCFDSNISAAKKASLSGETQNEPTVKAALIDKSRSLPLYGFNGNTSKGPSWTNKAFRDSVSSLHLKAIRYPGGTVSSFWEWQKGGFVNDAPPQKFKGKNTPNTLQDLKLLIDEAHCDVVFTLNMVTKDLQDQLEMLSSAQSLNIPVKWVELGNEFTNTENEGRSKFASAENYGKTCEQWIDAIKSRFPNAKVAVVGGNRNYSADVKNWNNNVLKNAPNADAIVAHLYPTKKTIMDDSEINFQKLFEGFVASFNKQGFNSINNKNIWVTEYNINWAADKDAQELKSKANTWSQALATLLMTSVTTSISPNITLILNHNIAGTQVFAAIETQKRTLQKLPNGIGMATWLTASDNMNSLDKLSFTNDNNQRMEDYQLFGWKFFNSNSSSFLLVNLSNSTVKLNLSNLTKSNASFETKYADKNAVINGAGDINYKTGAVDNGQIELPAYSVTVIKS